MALHGFLDEFQGRRLVPLLGDKGFQDPTLVIDGAPQVAHLATHLHVDLIEMPAPMGVGPHVLNPLAADLAGEHRAEPVPPQTHRLVADIDPALEQQVLDIAQRERVADVHHDHQPDHLRGAVKLAERVLRLGHAPG